MTRTRLYTHVVNKCGDVDGAEFDRSMRVGQGKDEILYTTNMLFRRTKTYEDIWSMDRVDWEWIPYEALCREWMQAYFQWLRELRACDLEVYFTEHDLMYLFEEV